MSTVDTKALRALREKATQGEWTDAGHKIGANGHGIAEVDFDNEHDLPYVVALVNAAPALLDEIERLRRIEEAALAIKTYDDHNGPEWKALQEALESQPKD